MGERGKAVRRLWEKTAGILLAALTISSLALAEAPDASSLPLRTASTTDTTIRILVLGDSYSAGNGGGDYFGPRRCFRSHRNYASEFAGLIVHRFGQSAEVVNRACSGATTADFTRAQSARVPAQLDAVDSTYDEIFLTIGGSDLGFAQLIRHCLVASSSDLGRCRSDVRKASRLLRSGTLRHRMTGVLKKIQVRAAPGARIVLLGYPYLEGDPGLRFGRYRLGTKIRKIGARLQTVQKHVVRDLGDALDTTQLAFVSTQQLFAGTPRWLPDRFRTNHEYFKAHQNRDRWMVQPPWDSAPSATYDHPDPRGWHEEAELLAHSPVVLRQKLTGPGVVWTLDVTVGQPLTESLKVEGGVAPFSVAWRPTRVVPPWISLSHTGRRVELSGTPDRTGSWTSYIDVTDATGRTVGITAQITSSFGPGQDLCSSQTDVSEAECSALEALYNATGGTSFPGWSHDAGWAVTTGVCDWYGVTCAAGHVQSLDLHFNQLSGDVPADIGNLTYLQDLNLWTNDLTSVPPEIGGLTNLQDLWVGGNQLTSVPAEIGSLTSLRRLWLEDNQLTSVPAEIGNLPSLQTLALGDNALSGLPPQLWGLTSLQELYLSSTQMTTLPSSVGDLVNLQVLTFDSNPLSTPLPTELWSLKKLQRLQLTSLGLDSIPADIGALSQLQSLYVGSNQLSDLPSQLWTLSDLRLLDVGGNQLTTIPPGIGNLTQLQSLWASNNALTSISDQLWGLSSLQDLRLSSDNIAVLPAAVAQLTGLQSLGLDGNQLTSVPPEIADLPKLSSLGLGGNNLTGDISSWAKPLSLNNTVTFLGLHDGAGGNNCLTAGGDTDLETWLKALDWNWAECS